MNEQDYMRRAIELARCGMGWANPNPMVGAVIVRDGRILSEGYHSKCGELHAERDAFSHLTESAEGATLYVTLEPCCHYGKQPPCTEAVVAHGIAKVVVGSRDPNPLVAGKGVAYLREHGIEVVEDFLRDECDAINDIFFQYITTNKTYVTVKYAMTLDGKIATKTGESQWITGPKARTHVHALRGQYAAIMVGINTVLLDDPMLNCRDVSAAGLVCENPNGIHQPLRIVVDSRLRIPMSSKLVASAREYPTLLAYADENADANKLVALQEAGVQTECLCGRDGHVDLEALFSLLSRRKIDSVIVEGGGELCEAVIRNQLADHVIAYVAPKLFGGADAKSPVEGIGIEHISEACELSFRKIHYFDGDIALEYDVLNRR